MKGLFPTSRRTQFVSIINQGRSVWFSGKVCFETDKYSAWKDCFFFKVTASVHVVISGI